MARHAQPARKHARKDEESSRPKGRGPLVAMAVAAVLLAVLGVCLGTGIVALPGTQQPDEAAQSQEASSTGDAQATDSDSAEAPAQEGSEAAGDSQSAAQEPDDGLAATVRATSKQIVCSGTPEGFDQTEGYAKLTQAVGGFEDKGYDLSFYLKDLKTGATVTYDPDKVRYPASSIKGPYLVSIYEMLVEKGQVRASNVSGLAQSLVINSDNEAFRTLHRTYGESVMGRWMESFGLSSKGYGGSYSYLSYYYPHTSATQLEAMWEHMYQYLSSGTDSATYLASLFSQRDVSPIREAVGSRYESWGKAGWYPSADGLGSAPATVDAGVVFSDTGDYVVVAMSDAPSDLDSLKVVFQGLDDAHASL